VGAVVGLGSPLAWRLPAPSAEAPQRMP
jgi:hypothetical protein